LALRMVPRGAVVPHCDLARSLVKASKHRTKISTHIEL
jgi:hypothetical protein